MIPFVHYKLASILLVMGLSIGFAVYKFQKLRKNSEKPQTYYYDSNNSKICSICLEDFPNIPSKNYKKVTLPCQHNFHSGCITPIIKEEGQKRCPNCRNAIPCSFTLMK